MGRLENKTVIVSGGANGIGEASVRLFAQEGAKVVVADILDDDGVKLAEELGPSVCFKHTDVTKEEEVKELVETTLRNFDRLDCMFNNAGAGGALGLINEISYESFQETVSIHLGGVFLGMKYAVPVMRKQKYGSVINMASTAGIQTGWAPHAYSAAKAAIIQLTRTAAVELGPDMIRVNSICPGAIATGIWGKGAGLPMDAIPRSVDNLRERFAENQPIARAGLVEDVARAALWLASDESSFVSGHALVIDGAATAGRIWTKTIEDYLAPALMDAIEPDQD